MRMAFVTIQDPADQTAWSGIPTAMAAGFRANGVELDTVGPLEQRRRLGQKVAQAAYLGMRRRHPFERHPAVLDGYARQVEPPSRRPGRRRDDPSSIPVAHVRAPRIAFWTDATFGVLQAEYPGMSHLSGASVRAGHAQEKAALERAAVAAYASRWAASSAVEHYGADPAKVHVVPFGANLDEPPPVAEVERLVEMRTGEPCRLLWVGSEWERKRGAFAVDVAGELNARGLSAEITLAGDRRRRASACPLRPPRGLGRQMGPLGRARFRGVLFGGRPLRAAQHGRVRRQVFAEASAYGVPSLAPAVGGVPDMLADGENGLLMSRDASPADWAAAIAGLIGDRGRYRAWR